jgi:hypothetical protein
MVIIVQAGTDSVVGVTCDSLGCLLHALSSGGTSASKLFSTAPGLFSVMMHTVKTAMIK